MNTYEIIEWNDSSILLLYSLKDDIDFDPDYQRMSDVWTVEKKQLLIDTILNGYDLPKIYIHEYDRPIEKNGRKYLYAVVDGKQRLAAIFDFIENRIPISEDFTFLRNEDEVISGLTYNELTKKFPRIKIRFDAKGLPIHIIRTTDIDVIEDMFSRLNEASPLNAAEKRNAFGGPIPKLIREISKHDFFSNRVHFNNKRYRHYDLIAKLLLLTYRERIVDTKKIYLDSFVKDFKNKQRPRNLKDKVVGCLDEMSKIYVQKDPLLKSVGLIPVFFWLTYLSINNDKIEKMQRISIMDFENKRKENRDRASNDIEDVKVDFDLLEFDRLVQTPNDSYSIRYKCEILSKHILNDSSQKEVITKLQFKKNT